MAETEEVGRSGADAPSGHSAEPEPISVVSAVPASVPNAVRRTISPWATVPRDGTQFHILNTLRFNPFQDEFQGLGYGEDDELKWFTARFHKEPTMWLRRVPLPYEPPASFAFTLTYECCRKTWRERLMERLFGTLWATTRHISAFHIASAIEARRAETAQTGSVEDESAVGAAETPEGISHD
jgi:hypothetical protein